MRGHRVRFTTDNDRGCPSSPVGWDTRGFPDRILSEPKDLQRRLVTLASRSTGETLPLKGHGWHCRKDWSGHSSRCFVRASEDEDEAGEDRRCAGGSRCLCSRHSLDPHPIRARDTHHQLPERVAARDESVPAKSVSSGPLQQDDASVLIGPRMRVNAIAIDT